MPPPAQCVAKIAKDIAKDCFIKVDRVRFESFLARFLLLWSFWSSWCKFERSTLGTLNTAGKASLHDVESKSNLCPCYHVLRSGGTR